jgi:hypothetical protein
MPNAEGLSETLSMLPSSLATGALVAALTGWALVMGRVDPHPVSSPSGRRLVGALRHPLRAPLSPTQSYL